MACARSKRSLPTPNSPPSFSYAGGLHLLPGVIAGPHQWSALHVTEAERHADLVETAELVRRDVAIECDVAVGWAQVLAERQDVDIHGAKVLHDRDDLLIGLAHAEDDAGLRRDVRREALGRGEDVHHPRIAAAGAAPLVQPRYRLRVVVVDVGLCFQHGANGRFLSLEVGHEHLDRRLWAARLDLSD